MNNCIERLDVHVVYTTERSILITAIIIIMISKHCRTGISCVIILYV